jgi:hypothetical protein
MIKEESGQELIHPVAALCRVRRRKRGNPKDSRWRIKLENEIKLHEMFTSTKTAHKRKRSGKEEKEVERNGKMLKDEKPSCGS